MHLRVPPTKLLLLHWVLLVVPAQFLLFLAVLEIHPLFLLTSLGCKDSTWLLFLNLV